VPLLNVAHDVPESCLIPEQACGQRRTPRLPQQLLKLTVDVAACHVDAPYGVRDCEAFRDGHNVRCDLARVDDHARGAARAEEHELSAKRHVQRRHVKCLE
jgi:hypothetical protein